MRSLQRVVALIVFLNPAITLFSQDDEDKPVITGQTPAPLVTQESTPITITLSNLIVSDAAYPDGFTLEVTSSDNYELNGTTVTPKPGFTGTLTVQVRVNDGENTSDWFDLKINVAGSSNVAPRITGQIPITIDQGQSATITFSHLTVSDSDDAYPSGFTLTVYSGNNYTVNGTTITPSPNFKGKLDVPVSVNDGEDESEKFNLKVDVKEVKNEKPKITGQVPLTINQGESLTIALSHLTVSDPDNNYPTDFTLTVYSGNNYNFSGTTITPPANFSGMLTVRISVNDGVNESAKFDLKIEVLSTENEAPTITGQVPLSINQGQSLTIALSHLTVSDPDNNYPTGFTLTVYSGNNYTVNGTTITPSPNFKGKLDVPVSINDGEDESEKFNLKVDVKEVKNEKPKITGQVPLTVNQGESITVALSHLIVSDPDSSYPTEFTLTVYDGNNYNFSGTTITPSSDFSGMLTVRISVNDGVNESAKFDLKIEVLSTENEAPKITGQVPLTINQGQSLTIALSHLTVSDPDNDYPTDFILTVYSGNNYTVNGATITPSPTFKGKLDVPVSVNDGENESEKFTLKVDVKEVKNEKPTITGQVPISINQGQAVTIALTHLTVSDPDNNYPSDFTLTVYNGAHYALSGNTITADASFQGDLKVQVSVNDGKNESNKFELRITVVKIAPGSPQILGQRPLSTNEDVPLELKISDLTVSDPDTSPQNLSITLSSGPNYSVSGTTIIPAKNYFGPLVVSVRISDNNTSSAPFELKVTVIALNDAPVITGQKEVVIRELESFPIKLTDLVVLDPDNIFPQDFTLKIKSGANYTVSGSTINISPGFSGILNIPVSVSDGAASSPDFNLRVEVISTETNEAPKIVGQKAISVTQNASITLQLFHLIVEDPDSQYPEDFTLKVFPGTNYSLNGTTVQPASNFVNGTISVGVTVNDGTEESNTFQVKIQVVPISATPRINGQKELTMMEDSTLAIKLTDLIVVDSDNPGYPKGFTLKVQSDGEGVYRVQGNSITPAPNLNGFIEVGVTVSDGVSTSDEFRLSILVIPVNDPPTLTLLETSALPCEPGKEPVEIFNRLALTDVDNDYLNMAEIGFRETNFNPRNDEILFDFDTTDIRVIRDARGTLFLIGYAPVETYERALRSMKYNYRITVDANGNPDEIPSGSRTVFAMVNDGQGTSQSVERRIEIEAKIELDIPSAFTPNGDHANDTWHLDIGNKDQLDQLIIRVYNKRGLLIYEGDALQKEWDGTFSGERVPVDTYYYTIVVKLPYVRQTFKGAVTILY